MRKLVLLLALSALMLFSGAHSVKAGELVYSSVNGSRIDVFADVSDSNVKAESLLIDGKRAEITYFSDSPSVNTVFVTDRSAINNSSKEDYCRIIRNILEHNEENDRSCFVSFDNEKTEKDVDFTGKQLDILNAAEKLMPSDGMINLMQPIEYSEKLFENCSDESFCRIILFTKTEKIESVEFTEKYKYPVYAVLMDDFGDTSSPDVSGLESAGFVFRYCQSVGKMNAESISDFIINSSRVCRISAVIPEAFLESSVERTVVISMMSDNTEFSFSKKMFIPSSADTLYENRKNRLIRAVAAVVFGLLIAAALAVMIKVLLKRKKRDLPEGSNTLNVNKTSVLGQKKGRGTLVSDAGTKMLFDNTSEYRIVLSGKGDNSRNIVLVSSKESVIGRNQYQADEVIYDERSVSQKHCRIYTRENRVFVEDLNSLNHTYVNGEEITDETEITTGSVLKLGRIEFDVQIIYGR